MSKKHDFLRSQQNRDKNPESGMRGSASEVAASNPDQQQGNTPKASNDHNKVGNTEATQTNQGRRTPESRHDRQTVNGTMNVTQARTGGKGGGRGTRGGNVGGSPN